MQDRPKDDAKDIQQKVEDLDKFFEQQRERKKLQSMINEFLSVQHSFHGKMDNLMQACREASGGLSEEQQQALEKLLGPYGILIANPFPEKPSGDILQDVADIMSVISKRNEHFHKMLPALMLSASNLFDLTQLLAQIRNDKQLAEAFLQNLKSKSWLDVESHVAQPHQNLVRYELLLKAMEKMIRESGSEMTDELLAKISETIAYIMPELSFFNEHREFLTQLNNIDTLMMKLTQLEAYKIEAVRRYILGARNDIAKGHVDVLNVLQGLVELLKDLQKDAEASLNGERNTLRAYAYNGMMYGVVGVTDRLFGENVIFAKAQVDPREEIAKVVLDLERQIGQIEFIRGKAGLLKF